MSKLEQRRNGSCHSKPSPTERSVQDALVDAARLRIDLLLIVQVYPRDWDKVILADALIAARNALDGSPK